MSTDTIKNPGQKLWKELSLEISLAHAASKDGEAKKLYQEARRIRLRFWPKFKELVASAKGQIATMPSMSFNPKILSEDENPDSITLYSVRNIDEYKALQMAYTPFPVAEVDSAENVWFCPSWLRSPKRWVFGKPLDKVLSGYRVFPQLVAVLPFKYEWIPPAVGKNTYGSYSIKGKARPIGYSWSRSLSHGSKTSAGIGLGFLEKAGSTEAEQYSSLMDYLRHYYSAVSLLDKNRALAFAAPTLTFDAMTEQMIKAFIRVNVLKVKEDAAEQRTLSGVGEAVRRSEDSERGATV